MCCFPLQGGHFAGIYRKAQIKPQKWETRPRDASSALTSPGRAKGRGRVGEDAEEVPVQAMMVFKYGGVLTHAGRRQVSSQDETLTSVPYARP